MTLYKVDFETMPWEKGIEGIRFKAVQHGGRQLRLVEYTAEMEPHWCEKGHIGYILQGRFELEFDGSTLEFGPGDGVFIPSGYEHRHMGRVLSGPVLAVFVEDD